MTVPLCLFYPSFHLYEKLPRLAAAWTDYDITITLSSPLPSLLLMTWWRLEPTSTRRALAQQGDSKPMT